MDFQVYRMGGQHVLSGGLYSSHVTALGRHLVFTYPPVSAILFRPFSALAVHTGQIVWDGIDLVALTALIAVSLAAARSRPLIGRDWRSALLLLAPVGFLLWPVRSDLNLGQINIVLVLMIVTDLSMRVSWRGRPIPQGVLVGLAAAIKLTPLVFLPYLALSGHWRAARNAAVTFLGATGVMFAVAPRASWLYFTKDAFAVSRVGHAEGLSNQTLHAAIVRAHLSLPSAVLDVVVVGVLCGGIALAVVAHRRSSALLGALVCAATGLLVSPISWLHHFVWIVPALVWLTVGTDRPARGKWWALVGALAFYAVPPFRPGGTGMILYVRDNAYIVMTFVFLAVVGHMLWTRRRPPAAESDPRSPRIHPARTSRPDPPALARSDRGDLAQPPTAPPAISR
jgi:alpha-1,2-mannosyltransferase